MTGENHADGSDRPQPAGRGSFLLVGRLAIELSGRYSVSKLITALAWPPWLSASGTDSSTKPGCSGLSTAKTMQKPKTQRPCLSKRKKGVSQFLPHCTNPETLDPISGWCRRGRRHGLCDRRKSSWDKSKPPRSRGHSRGSGRERSRGRGCRIRGSGGINHAAQKKQIAVLISRPIAFKIDVASFF